MKITPYIDPDGITRERERAVYRPVLIHDKDSYAIGFLPQGEGLTCLEFVRIFAIALRPEISPEVAAALADMLRRHAVGLEAIYEPETDPRPNYPEPVLLRAA
jgi:hypothetical protein